jgi:CheY-like chemotaxis protein
MVEAGERAAALTRQLLMFSRRQIVRPERLDLNGVVAGLEKMLRRVIGEDIDLWLNLTKDGCTVLADPSEIEQILMNLVINARDAMPAGGHLSIETAACELDDDYAPNAGVIAGPYVLLTVSDTGCGMDAETKGRAFEPFFTTKGKVRGTGLGLSTCYGIVQRCCGHIAIYTELGHGTAFKVYLPRLDGPADVRPLGSGTPDVQGSETILLVEDDADLRRTIGRVLDMRGYHVLDSASGAEAVASCEQHGGRIDLVISDMVMPGLNGPDTVAQVRLRRPDVKVLHMSGYSDHALLRSGAAARVNFIQKPFTPTALAAKVREVLDA